MLPYTYTHRPLQLRVCVWFNAYQHAVAQIALKTAFGIFGALAGLVLTTNKVTSFSALSSHIVLSCLELIETSSSSNSPTSNFQPQSPRIGLIGHGGQVPQTVLIQLLMQSLSFWPITSSLGVWRRSVLRGCTATSKEVKA